jgi:hypothetical protein
MKRLFTILEPGLQQGEVWKSPTEVFDVTFDFSRLLAGDTIASAVWTLPENWTQPLASSISAAGTSAKVWVGGGGEGTLGALRCVATTAAGRVWDVWCLAHVRENPSN